jgi:hypothetical protein
MNLVDASGQSLTTRWLHGQAIAMQPKLVSIYDQRARAYVKMERLDKALDDVTNIVRLEPGNALVCGRAPLVVAHIRFSTSLAFLHRATSELAESCGNRATRKAH